MYFSFTCRCECACNSHGQQNLEADCPERIIWDDKTSSNENGNANKNLSASLYHFDKSIYIITLVPSPGSYRSCFDYCVTILQINYLETEAATRTGNWYFSSGCNVTHLVGVE